MHRTRQGFIGIMLLALSLISAGNLRAQETTGSIRGTVFDPSGAGVPRALVTATQVETGASHASRSNQDGSYVLVLLPIGHYRLEVSAKGFQAFVQEGITLTVDEAANVPIHLAVGLATQSVIVTANAAVIETADTTMGETVGEREILDLPLNGRNFSQLGLLQPGVVPITPGLAEAGGSLRDGQPYSVNGQRPESNNFLIDGASNVDAVDGGFVLKPPIDAIAEFKILTHTANAEFGSNAGSTTNIITRSGSNEFNGTAWEFLRNDKLDAANFFENADGFQKSEYRQNQFGATLGGPIQREKTFFFGYYEGFRNRQGEVISHVRVPSALERQGNFSQDGPLFAVVGFGPMGPILAPVPGGILPGIDPTAAKVTQLYPAANATDSNGALDLLNASQILRDNEDQAGLRIDHYFSSHTSVNFRYMFLNGTRFDPLSTAGAGVPGFPVGEDHRTQNFVVQLTHSFSPSVVDIARFSFLRNKFLFDQHLNSTSPASLGFQYQPTLGVAAGPPFIQFAGEGYATIGDPITGPRNTYENAFAGSDSLTWIRGRHEFKVGGDFRRDQINAVNGIASNGFFVFVDQFPFTNSFASFLSGQPIFFLQGGGDQPGGGGDLSRGLRGSDFNFYAQDTYKVSPRLTLNAGLRYELPLPYTEIRNRDNLYEPGVQSKVMPDAPPGLVYPGDPGVTAGLIPAEKNAFAPRLGVAWDPTGSARWLVRAAYGVFYDPYYNGQGGALQAPISAPPYLRTPQLSFPQVGSLSNPFANGNPFTTPFGETMTLLTLDPHLRLPYAQDWNLNLERSLGADWLLEVGYVGTKGTKLPRFIEDNPSVPNAGETWAEQQSNIDPQRINCLPTAQGNCNYSSVGLIVGAADSSYNALETSLRKRFSHGVSFLASYTFSKSIDDVSSFNITGSASQPVAGENDLAQNPFDLAAERGRSMFDARHRGVISYQWQIPLFQQPENWYQTLLGNWQVNGITTFMSGTPFTVEDQSFSYGAPEISGFSAFRPNLVGNPNHGPKTVQEWFDTGAFQPIPKSALAGTYGTEGRNVVQGPGYAQWDFSALKDFRVTESKTLQFRAEFFNIFNRANFRLPNSDISSTTFGQIQEALSPRLIQFALKFMF